MSLPSGPANATQAKDRNYMQLGHSLARLSRAVGQTTDLCELLKINLDYMKVLSATHAAQFMTVAAELRVAASGEPEEPDENARSINEVGSIDASPARFG